MPPAMTDQLMRISLVAMDLGIGFALLWMGQLLYRKVFRRLDLNLELFVRDNLAVAIALVGFYLGLVTALSGVFSQLLPLSLFRAQILVVYGAITIGLMLAGAWIGDRLILRHLDAAREIREEQNLGAAAVEAGFHLANGLLLSAALAGEEGSWWVGAVCWGIGISVLVGVSFAYPMMAKFNVFQEIRRRNNPAVGVAFAGLLIATGNIVRFAFAPEFKNWTDSLLEYGLLLGIGLLALAAVRWVADLVLVPGVKISDEIVNQTVPNLGAGLIEAIAYISGSFLIVWSF